MKHRSGVLAVAAILSVTGASVAGAADYPAREVEFVVAFPAGGPADISARLLAPIFSAALKNPVVVVNKPGGGGTVGSDFVARARPDGHTVYVSTNSVFTINPHVRKLPYAVSDFAPIGAFAVDLGVIGIRNIPGVRNLEEFVEYAKKNPGKLSYGSAGLGTVSFFSMEIFKLAYGLDINHVPFQGTGPVRTALLGNHIQVASSGFGSLSVLIKSGDMIPLATTSPTRLPAYPSMPTMAEKGFPEASLNIWMGVYVPVKTPKPVVDTLVRALAQVAKEQALAAGLEKVSMALDYRDPAGTAELIARESGAVAKVVDRLKLPKE